MIDPETPACPDCGGPLRQTRRGATLARRGPAFTCPLAEAELERDARGHLRMRPGARHRDVRSYRPEEVRR